MYSEVRALGQLEQKAAGPSVATRGTVRARDGMALKYLPHRANNAGIVLRRYYV